MRKSRRGDDEESSLPKIIILVASLALVFMSTSVILAAYPQHILINNKTVIDAVVGFGDNRSVNIKGNQVQYGQGAIIPLNGQEIIIVGNQVQLGDSTFTSGIRTVSAKIYQNVLFEQPVGEFSVSRAAQVGIDGDVIALIPASSNTINIRSANSNYIVEFVQGITYIKTKNGVMLKLQQDNNEIKVFVIGLMNYDNIWMRVV